MGTQSSSRAALACSYVLVAVLKIPLPKFSKKPRTSASLGNSFFSPMELATLTRILEPCSPKIMPVQYMSVSLCLDGDRTSMRALKPSRNSKMTSKVSLMMGSSLRVAVAVLMADLICLKTLSLILSQAPLD